MNGKIIGEQVEENVSKRLINFKKKKNHLSLSARWVPVYIISNAGTLLFRDNTWYSYNA